MALYNFDGDIKDVGGRYNGRWIYRTENYGIGKFNHSAKFTGRNSPNIILNGVTLSKIFNGNNEWTIS